MSVIRVMSIIAYLNWAEEVDGEVDRASREHECALGGGELERRISGGTHGL